MVGTPGPADPEWTAIATLATRYLYGRANLQGPLSSAAAMAEIDGERLVVMVLRADGSRAVQGHEVAQARSFLDGGRWQSAKDFTCYTCRDRDSCPYSFDGYNTNGDCLADK